MNKKFEAKPFLKWAGGKTQLISHIEKVLPQSIYTQEFTYIESFVGGGAVLFWMLNKFSNLKKVVANDINENLINTYKIIVTKPNELISVLETLQNEFHNCDDQKSYYYAKRKLYNLKTSDNCVQAALFIFLNHTCFNGLYRVNKRNLFNVPMGSYKKPTIYDRENILAVSQVLQKVQLISADFEETLKYAEGNTLFYLDPPYKPINKTSNFTFYTSYGFDDNQQIRLKNFCCKLNELGYKWILSNSDNEDFFKHLYSGFKIQKVNALRNINSNGRKRNKINELLISN